MITTRFESYCENCRELEVETETTDYAPFRGGQRHTCIYCAHESRCRAIRDSVKQEMEETVITNIQGKPMRASGIIEDEAEFEKFKKRYQKFPFII